MTDDFTAQLPAERPDKGLSYSAIGFGESGFDLTPQTLGEVVAFASVMARSQHAIRKHLRENPGACMAVTLDAMHLRMSPFALANKSYLVNDQLAYESQVFTAAINMRAPIKKRSTISYDGDGDKRKCTVVLHLKDGDQPYTSPEMGKIHPKNSPLWNTDPDRQLAYYSLRAAAKIHCPEVLLGMMDVDEAAEGGLQNVTPDRNAPTGMLARLQDRGQAVDPDGFNVRKMAEELEPSNPEPEPPKQTRRRPTKARLEELEKQGYDDGRQYSRLGEETLSEFTEGELAAYERGHDRAALEAKRAAQPVEVVDEETGEVLDAERPITRADDTETELAPPAPEEPASSDSATSASGATAAETSSPQAPSEPSQNGAVNDAVFEAFWKDVTAADSWLVQKALVLRLYTSDAFKGLTPTEQREMRAAIWGEVEAMRVKTRDPVDIIEDPTAFRIWCDTQTGVDGADAIQGTFDILQSSRAFERMVAEQQARLTTFVAERCEELRG